MRKPSIVLADDHQIVLDGLRSLLEGEFHLAATVNNGRELLRVAEELRPDVLVVDISMPGLNGIDAVLMLKERRVESKIVFLTMHPDSAYLLRALEAGGDGYVLKHAASDELVTALRSVLAGKRYISPILRAPAVEERLDETKRHLKSGFSLTARQREVLQLIAEGKSAKEIGAALDISPRTVEAHKYKLMDDLGVRTTAALVQQAIRLGMVAP